MNAEPGPGIEQQNVDSGDGGDEDRWTTTPIIRSKRKPGDERDAFAATLAHELRTPLTILKGRLHGLEDGIIGPSTGECGRLLDQVDRLLQIIDDVGLLTRLRAGHVVQDKKRADLSAILCGSIDRASAMFLNKRADTVVRCEPTSVWVDPILLARLLDKIVVFAVGHMTQGAFVEVDGVSGSEAHLAIRWASADPTIPDEAGSEGAELAGDESLDLQVVTALAEAIGGTVSLARPSQKVTTLDLTIPSHGTESYGRSGYPSTVSAPIGKDV